MKRTIFLVLLIGTLLTGCYGSGISDSEARQVATQAALGTPPPPKYLTAAAVYLHVTLTPMPTPYAGTPTMNIEQYSATMISQQQNIGLTKAALDLIMERERIAALEKEKQSMATAEAAKSTAQAIDAIRTAEAREVQQIATAQQNAANTQSALVFIQQTQAAQGVETQQAAQLTAAVEPTHAMWTVTAVSIQQRISEGQARDVELAVRRQEMKNGFDAYGPWLMVVAVFIVSSEGFKKWLKTRVFKRDEHGKLPTISTEADDGKKVFAKLDLLPVPIFSVDKVGNVDVPPPSDPAEQSAVTRRMQAIEAISFLPSPYAQQGTKMMNTEFGGQKSTPNIFTRNNPALSPVLDEAEAQLLEDA